MVTKSPEAAVTCGDQVRKTLFRALKRDSRIAITLRGDHHLAIETAYRSAVQNSEYWTDLHLGRRRGVGAREVKQHRTNSHVPSDVLKVLSSDLSAASDLLPLDFVGALVEGFAGGCKWA
jgi:hypothetical protein